MVRSFAGQFKSVLNMQGIDNVFQAIWSIWGTATADNVQSYLKQHNISAENLLMGVIIQEMITPVYAGVALSRNPVTGADEVVVEAVEGSGEALVQSGVTPYRWINKWGTYIHKPEKEDVPNDVIEQIVNETRTIAEKLKSHFKRIFTRHGKTFDWLYQHSSGLLHVGAPGHRNGGKNWGAT